MENFVIIVIWDPAKMCILSVSLSLPFALHPRKSWEMGLNFGALFRPYICLSLAEYKIFISAPSEAKIMPKFAS